MADNINIRYRVDTGQLKAAEGQLLATDAANTKLRAGVQQTASISQQAYGQMSNTLAGMRLRLQQIDSLRESTSRKDIERLRQLNREYGLLKAEIDKVTAANKEQSAAMSAASAQTTKLTSNFGQLYNAVKLFIAAGVAREVLDITLQMTELSGKIDGVSRAFKTQIPNSTALLEELRRKTRGTIDELQLMQYAIKAQNFKIPLNDLGNLLEFALTRAQQTGESIDYMVNSIITGLGRDSIKILDNLQVDIGAMKKDMNELGISIDEAFGIQVQREIQKMGGLVETDAVKVNQLKAAAQELYQTLSQQLASGWMVDFLKESAQGLTFLLKSQTDEEKRQQRIESAASNRVKNIQDEANGYKDISDQIRVVSLAFDQNRKQVLENQILIKDFQAEMKKADNYYDLKKLAEEKNALEERTQVLSVVVESLQKVREELTKQAAIPITERGAIEIVLEKIEKLEEIIPTLVERDLPAANRQLKELNEELKRLQALGVEPTENFDRNASAAFDIRQRLDQIAKQITQQLGTTPIEPVIPVRPKYELKEDDEEINGLKLEIQARAEELKAIGIDSGAEIIKSQISAEVEMYQTRLELLQNYYDEQMILAGDNEAAKDRLRVEGERKEAALRRKIAEEERKARRYSVIVDTAAGIMKAFATSATTYEAIVNAAIVAFQGLTQLSTINNARGFNKGVIGVQDSRGQAGKDSIPSMLTPGESVITESATKGSRRLLEKIQAKQIDDRVLDGLVVTPTGVIQVQADNSDIVEAIQSNAVDYFMQGSILMEHREKQAKRFAIIKAKSI